MRGSVVADRRRHGDLLHRAGGRASGRSFPRNWTDLSCTYRTGSAGKLCLRIRVPICTCVLPDCKIARQYTDQRIA